MTSSTDGPDQGDPAAWAIYGGVTGDYKGVTDDDEEAESKRAGGYRVVPLGPLRAPGAVAAAPPAVFAQALVEAREERAGARIAATPRGPRRSRAVAAAPPGGCAWCGVEEREHASRFHETPGQHTWAAPTDAQRLARMRQRSAAPLAGRGAVTAAPPDDEDEIEYAADAVFPLHVGRHTPWERDHAREVWDAFRARLVPPAGREDEAAVERAVDWRAVAGALMSVNRGGERITGTLDEFAASVTDALAAARGPRTPDPGTGA